MSLIYDERNDIANLSKYLRKCELLYTVFLWIVVATTILFLGFGCDNNSRETTIQGRKLLISRIFWVRQLFKEDNYSREETIRGNTVLRYFYILSECSALQGTIDGPCASAFGVCCIFTNNFCGSTISHNRSYLW